MLILASGSPRRRELLSQAGYAFRVVPSAVEEIAHSDGGIGDLVETNAALKCRDIAAKHPSSVVLGADTLVFLGDQPLGKPADLDQALEMLRSLAGRTHSVATGVCLCDREQDRERRFHVVTQVTFLPLSEAQIRDYLDRINPLDKAGSYAAQEHGHLILEGTEGSWTNIVGLPMEKLGEELSDFGITPTLHPA